MFMRPDLGLSENALTALARQLSQELEASTSAKGSLDQRWRANRDAYHGTKAAQAPEQVDGMGGYCFPISKPSLNRICNSMYSNLTMLDPTCQVIDMSNQGRNVESVERTLQNLMDRSGFRRELKPVLLEALNSNASCMRVVPKLDPNTQRVCGLECSSIRPEELVVYPAYKKVTSELTTCGMLALESLSEVQAKMDSGEYIEYNIQDIFTGASDEGSNRQRATDSLLGDDTQVAFKRDEPVQIAELITLKDLSIYKSDLVDQTQEVPKETKMYRIVLATESEKILQIQEYGAAGMDKAYSYDQSWIVDFRAMPATVGFWTDDSIANGLQDLQNTASAILTILIEGAMSTAFPMVIVKGGSLGAKYKKNKSGMWIDDLPPNIQVDVIDSKFTPGVLPQLLEQIQSVADGVTDVGRLASGQALPASASATEAAILGQNQQAAQDEYLDAVSPSVERIWGLAFMYLKTHYDDLKATMGDSIVCTWEEIKDLKPKFVVTGTTGTANPQMLLSKYQLLIQQAQMPGSRIDVTKVEDKMVQAMDLPFTYKAIMKGDNVIAAEAMAQAGGNMEDVHSLLTGQQPNETNTSNQGVPNGPAIQPGMGGNPVPSAPQTGGGVSFASPAEQVPGQ
jgi:hypothetical protein